MSVLTGNRLPANWEGAGFRPWPQVTGERALVLGGGGATGIAWESGILAGLRDGGADVSDADTIIGTSAGSMVGAHLRLGTADDVALGRIRDRSPLQNLGRLGPRDAVRFLAAQATPHPSRGRALIGRSALRATTASEEEFLEIIGSGLAGQPWPNRRLLVTAVDAETGAGVVFHNDSDVPLERAVAASCSVPGVFPAVTIGGRRYVDGGVRSVANIDLAAGHRRVLVLAPIPLAVRRRDRPGPQVRELGPSVASTLLVPDVQAARAMGPNPFDMRRGQATLDAAHAQGLRLAPSIGDLWFGPEPS